MKSFCVSWAAYLDVAVNNAHCVDMPHSGRHLADRSGRRAANCCRFCRVLRVHRRELGSQVASLAEVEEEEEVEPEQTKLVHAHCVL